MLWRPPVYQITIPMIRSKIWNLCIVWMVLWIFLGYNVEGFDTAMREMTNIVSNPVAVTGGSGNVASGGVATAVRVCATRMDGAPPDSLGYDPCVPQERNTTTSEHRGGIYIDGVRIPFEDYPKRKLDITTFEWSKFAKAFLAEVMHMTPLQLYKSVIFVLFAICIRIMLDINRQFSLPPVPVLRNDWDTPSPPPEPVSRNVKDIPAEAVSSEDMTCIVCWVNAKNIMVEPCGHVAACETCSLQLTNPECLICELPVTKMRRIFL